MTGPTARSGPRRVVVVRHAETVDNAARVWQGHKDTELSDRGREQVQAAAPHLAAYAPALIVSSDLRRAASTSSIQWQLSSPRKTASEVSWSSPTRSLAATRALTP